jgi:hypothetical protein
VRHAGRPFDIAGVQVTNRPTDVPRMLRGNTDRAVAAGCSRGGWLVLVRHPPFELVFRMEGADPAVARRDEDHGVGEVLIWADQVWPEHEPLEAKRAALVAVAAALGLTR